MCAISFAEDLCITSVNLQPVPTPTASTTPAALPWAAQQPWALAQAPAHLMPPSPYTFPLVNTSLFSPFLHAWITNSFVVKIHPEMFSSFFFFFLFPPFFVLNCWGLGALSSGYHNVSKHNRAKISPGNSVERAGACTFNRELNIYCSDLCDLHITFYTPHC